MKKLIALALCLVLCLGLCAGAFAEDTVSQDPYAAATSGFVKLLNMSDLIESANLTFTFSFAADTANSTDGAAAEAFSVKFVSKDFTGTLAADTKKLAGTGDQQSGAWMINELFPATSDGKLAHGIDHAGTWAFTVTESSAKVGSNEAPATSTLLKTLTDTPAAGYKTEINHQMTKSADSYTLLIDVTNGSDGTLGIAGVIVKKDGDKVNPTVYDNIPGTPGTSGTEGSNQFGSGFQFNNTYVQTKKITPPEGGDPGAFNVSKKVATSTTDGGDRADRTKAFKFTITLKKPASYSAASVTGTITADTTQPIVLPEGVTQGSSVTFTFGTDGTATQVVYLSHGDKIVFDEMPIGLNYTVVEDDYKTSDGYESSLGSTLTKTGKITESSNDSTAVTNTLAYTPPTGISVNNLPFAIIMILAVSGMAFYFVANRRKQED